MTTAMAMSASAAHSEARKRTRKVSERERLAFRGRIISGRGATTAGLILPASRIQEVRINGTRVPLRPTERYWRAVRVVTLPAEGAEFEVSLTGGQAATFFAYDTSSGLPTAAMAAARSRGDEYVPLGSGDRVMVAARVDVP